MVRIPRSACSMRVIGLPFVIGVVTGTVLGFTSGAFVCGGASDAEEDVRLPLRAAPREKRREPAPSSSEGSVSLGVVKDEPAVAGERAVASNGPRAAELRQMRAREQAAQEQLSLARKRIAQLENRPRHEFDLTPEDWKHLADNGIIKYRLPCANSNAVPTDRVFDELGLAPEDREVFRGAFENSGKRLREKLVPLCAAALGGRMDLAESMSVDSCRHILLSTAATRGEDASASAQRVASFMAGEGPRPGEDGGVTDQTFLVLVEESKWFEEELAQAFGPDDAHRLVFSDQLCFTSASHQLGRFGDRTKGGGRPK